MLNFQPCFFAVAVDTLKPFKDAGVIFNVLSAFHKDVTGEGDACLGGLVNHAVHIRKDAVHLLF